MEERQDDNALTVNQFASSTKAPNNLHVLDWKIHEFRSFHMPLDSNSFGPDGDIWKSRLDLQDLGAGLVLAGDRRGWNSAICRIYYTIRPHTLVLSGKLKIHAQDIIVDPLNEIFIQAEPLCRQCRIVSATPYVDDV